MIGSGQSLTGSGGGPRRASRLFGTSA